MKFDNFKKYRLIYITSIIISLIFIVIMNTALFKQLIGSTVYVLLMVAFVFLFRAVNKKMISKYIHSILFKQFDAYALDDLFKKYKFPKASIPTQIIASYHTGDYQKAVDLCAYLLLRKKKAQDKYKHLLILARVYFEVGDTEKLAQVVDAFDNLLSNEKNKEKVVQCYIEISFYRAYLENNLEKIEEFYHKLNESYSKNPDNKIIAMVKYQIDTYYAIICCGNGNTDVAKKLFTGVAEAVPNLNYSALAKKYLNSIESGMPVVFEEVLPNYGEKIVDPEAIIKKFRIIVLVCYICYIIIAGFIVIYPQVKDKLDSELHLTHEEKLDRAITAVNSDYTLMKSFEVSYSDGLVDVIGLVEADGKVDVGVFVTDDNGDPIEFLLNIKDTINNRVMSITQFYIDTPKTDKIIGYKVFNDKNDITKTYLRTVEIDFNGEKVWLCINHIGKTFPEKDKYLENYYFRSEKS